MKSSKPVYPCPQGKWFRWHGTLATGVLSKPGYILWEARGSVALRAAKGVMEIYNYLNPLDVEAIARRYRASLPFPHFHLDDFLRPEFARRVSRAFPTYAEAVAAGGKEFRALNENLKIQVTDKETFPESVQRLNEVLSSHEFREILARITGIDHLLADPLLQGGGMHLMGSGGRLDVHVDFNLLRPGNLHRRLNILVFFNEEWREEWGGQIDLWDEEVQERVAALAPVFNRCLIFNTTEKSWHGVTPIRSPRTVTRNSFAAYYYTKEAPRSWDGAFHSTVFRPRPDERWRIRLLKPAERSAQIMRRGLHRLKRAIGRLR